MSRPKHEPDYPGWLKMTVTLAVAVAAAAGAVGHVASGPTDQPVTSCVRTYKPYLRR